MNQTKALMAAGLTIVASIFLLSVELQDAFADDAVIISIEPKPVDCEKTACISYQGTMINVSQTVTWQNNDSTIHEILSGTPDSGRNGLFESGSIMPGEHFSFTFKNDGMYNYYCAIHPWMIGVVYVK